ncbi:hypothetical protein WJX79_004381 [Trebouxia sp. C0005]
MTSDTPQLRRRVWRSRLSASKLFQAVRKAAPTYPAPDVEPARSLPEGSVKELQTQGKVGDTEEHIYSTWSDTSRSKDLAELKSLLEEKSSEYAELLKQHEFSLARVTSELFELEATELAAELRCTESQLGKSERDVKGWVIVYKQLVDDKISLVNERHHLMNRIARLEEGASTYLTGQHHNWQAVPPPRRPSTQSSPAQDVYAEAWPDTPRPSLPDEPPTLSDDNPLAPAQLDHTPPPEPEQAMIASPAQNEKTSTPPAGAAETSVPPVNKDDEEEHDHPVYDSLSEEEEESGEEISSSKEEDAAEEEAAEASEYEEDETEGSAGEEEEDVASDQHGEAVAALHRKIKELEAKDSGWRAGPLEFSDDFGGSRTSCIGSRFIHWGPLVQDHCSELDFTADVFRCYG